MHSLERTTARWLGNRRAFKSLQRLVVEHRPTLLFVSETKISCNVGTSRNHLLVFVGCVGVDPVGCSGGSLFFWTNAIKVDFCSYSVGHVDYLVSCSNLYLRFTGIYRNLTSYL